jgi:murein L,D-transpeptidase YafK
MTRKRGIAFILLGVFLLVVALDHYLTEREAMERKRSRESKNTETAPGTIHPPQSTPQSDQDNASKLRERAEETHDTASLEETQIKPPRQQPTLSERLAELGAQIGDPVFIRIFKYTAELELWIKVGKRYELLHTYEVCRQSGYLGPKLKEGDKQGPEGFYYVTKRRLNPNSRFHLAFNIGYPNAYDRAHKRTGSALMVHGDCVSVGCFAMTDEKIEEIYELVEQALEKGQKIVRVHIFPFRMSEEKMAHYRSNRWYDFWSNLKEGYDYFEEKRVPPNVTVKNLKYSFE